MIVAKRSDPDDAKNYMLAIGRYVDSSGAYAKSK